MEFLGLFFLATFVNAAKSYFEVLRKKRKTEHKAKTGKYHNATK